MAANRNRPKTRGKKGAKDKTRLAIRVKMRHEAVKLMYAGAEYRDISDQLKAKGYPCSLYTAYYICQEALSELDEATAKIVPKLREREVGILNRVQLHVWPKVQDKDVPAGRLVLGLSARRAALQGLDAPQKVTATNLDGTRPYRHETDEENDARIRQLAKEAGFEIVDSEVVEADGGRTEGR